MTGDIGEKGSCTTCAYTEDFSNYWTATMYFRHENGSYKRVPQYPNANLGTQGANDYTIKGGMTIYYTQKDFYDNGLSEQNITAFPPVSYTSLSPQIPCLLTDTTPGIPHDGWKSRH